MVVVLAVLLIFMGGTLLLHFSAWVSRRTWAVAATIALSFVGGCWTRSSFRRGPICFVEETKNNSFRLVEVGQTLSPDVSFTGRGLLGEYWCGTRPLEGVTVTSTDTTVLAPQGNRFVARTPGEAVLLAQYECYEGCSTAFLRVTVRP